MRCAAIFWACHWSCSWAMIFCFWSAGIFAGRFSGGGAVFWIACWTFTGGGGAILDFGVATVFCKEQPANTARAAGRATTGSKRNVEKRYDIVLCILYGSAEQPTLRRAARLP